MRPSFPSLRGRLGGNGAHQHPGSLLLEAIVAVALFAIFLGSVGLTLVIGERSTIAGGDRVAATFIAERQLEGLRQMRSADFSSVNVTGFHALEEVNGAWQFSSQVPLAQNGYKSVVELISRSSDWLEARAKVDWNFGQTRSGSVVLGTYLTNWRQTAPVMDCTKLPLTKSLTIDPSPQFQQIAVSGNYAFVASVSATDDVGLYIFDVTQTPPLRVAQGFTLNADAYSIDINPNANQLYVATTNSNLEFQVFNISSPSTLGPGDLVGSFDINGAADAQVRALTAKGSSTAVGRREHFLHRALGFLRELVAPIARANLPAGEPGSCGGTPVFIGTSDHPTDDELYAFSVDSAGDVSPCGSINLGQPGVATNVSDISLLSSFAYVATDRVNSETIVVDVYDPTLMEVAGGEDLPVPVQRIEGFGTNVLSGMSPGPAFEEFRLSSVVNAPFMTFVSSREIGESISGISVSTDMQCAFVTHGGTAGSQLQTYTLPTFGSVPPAAVYSIDTSVFPPIELPIMHLAFDWATNRLYAITKNTLYIFAPGT